MAARRLVVPALLGTMLATWAPPADAIMVLRVTRHGYIVADEPDNPMYGTIIPVANIRDTESFLGDVTTALDALPGFHEGHYLAAMQLPAGSGNALAFYLPIRNDVNGIGQVSPLDGRSEVFDLNSQFGTAWPLEGFVYLNTLEFYTDPRAVNFGRYLICTQEFGHRFGATSQIVPFPGVSIPPPGDGSVTDGAVTDGSVTDASVSDAAGTDGATGDVPGSDSGGADAGPILALTRDALLGRGNQTPSGMVVNRAHWSYFFHTGGSPMEGNNWMQSAPGVFQTLHPTFRFSDLDLYNMGLMAPEDVRPSFYIAQPTMVPGGVSRDAPPEYNARTVTVHGRRLDVTIDDIVRANGARRPAFPDTPRDMDVVWVLLASPADVDDTLASEFDQAIESCALGYGTSTADRGHLLNSVPDGGADSGIPDSDAAAGTDGAVDQDGGAMTAQDGGSVGDGAVVTGTDGAVLDADMARPELTSGGCACSAVGTSGAPSHGAPAGAPAGRMPAGGLAVLGAAVCAAARRRRTVVRCRP